MRNVIITALISFLFFSGAGVSCALDEREAMKRYLADINPVLTKAQVASRNISQRLLPLGDGVKQMRDCVESLSAMNPPKVMLKQHKMILLSFKKLRMGFYLLLNGDRPRSVVLVKSGAVLLRAAVKDMVELGKREGLIKENPETKK